MVVRSMRLAKFLATSGVARRRPSEVLVREGRVTLDGVVTTAPARDVGRPRSIGGGWQADLVTCRTS